MTSRIVLLAAAIAGFSSCATYRTGQTPDDVYYSPARETTSYVETQKDEDNRTSYNDLEDQRLRQQIRNQRFRNFDDDIYWTNPRWNSGWNTWNNGWGFNSWNSPYWGWNTWNSPIGWNNWGFGYSAWNSPFYCVPGTTIIIAGPGAPKNSSGLRYSPLVQTYTGGSNNNGGYNGKGGYNGGNGGGRYFGGASNNNNGQRGSFFNSFFGGGSSNNSSGNRTYNGSSNSGSGSRFFGGSEGGGGSRTFGGSGSSGGSSGGGSRSGGTGGRRN